MTIASDLLQRHIQTLVDDNTHWQTLIADDIVWELAYAPALGHPARLSGRTEVIRHVTWFLGAVENFRFFDLQVYPFADPQAAVAQSQGRGTYQTYRAHLPPRICSVPSRGRREDRVHARIFRSYARGQGARYADP